MGHELIEEFIAGDSPEIRDLANNQAALVGFLTLIKGVDDLPEMNARFYEKPRSLYQVTSSGQGIEELMTILAEFFGPPASSPGKNLPVSLRFDPTVKFLGGIRKDQALFLKKLKTGSFYGALWPWQRDRQKIEILIGFYASSMSDADLRRMEALVQKFLSQKKLEAVSEVGGQIHGISLPSFLQMSEMEGATYTLKVTSGKRTGHLYLDGGSLIAARYGDLTGSEAAYRIISWDKAAIQIEAADPDREREIREPLMHVMMESLKIKDEQGAAPEPPPPPPPPEAQPELEMQRKPPAQKEAVAPAKEPVAKPAAMPPPPYEKPPAPGKPEDRSIGKQDQMSTTTKLLIALGVVIVFALVVTFGGNMLRKWQVDRRYERLVADLAATRELDSRVVMLLQYIKAHPNDPHRQELEDRLTATNTEIEQRAYQKTIADVERLPIDENYENKALSLYTAFLAQYPQSPYAEKIDEAIGGIHQLVGASTFQELKKMTSGDYLERYAVYRDYLEQFPQSAERAAVERMIEDLALEYYRAIESQAAACDEEGAWDACIAACDRFLSRFANTAAAEKVSALRKDFQEKRALAALTAEADLLAQDPAKAKKLYTDYLAENPQTSLKAAILERIEALDAALSRQMLWKNTAAFAANPNNDIFSRIERLDTYIDEHAAGPYAPAARELRKKIEPQLQAALRAQRSEAARRKELAAKQAEAARVAEEARRILRLRSQVARQLAPVSDRYRDNGNGTVTDRVTGLTWSLLDSQMELDRCISYDAAKSYVQGLGTGGYSDWRLPTAGELAALYKSSPYFPDTGAAWYWTSESFARGYHRVVDVVTPVPESAFTRVSKTVDSCGAVRAVRR
ncbi:MAG TPA: DUF1566 domain-containing protein [Desulfosarcina sp.]|nr:DUF1566 domain-containing protein [Desulfosarcina sp.]